MEYIHKAEDLFKKVEQLEERLAKFEKAIELILNGMFEIAKAIDEASGVPEDPEVEEDEQKKEEIKEAILPHDADDLLEDV
jgi:hypothetical protein